MINKLANINRDVSTLTSVIVDGSTLSVGLTGAGAAARKLTSEGFDIADTSSFFSGLYSFFLRSVQRDERSNLDGGKGVAPC